MKIVKPNAELLTADTNELKLIERIGRVCYKSEDRITDDSYKDFISMLVGRHHLAMMEHGTLYLRMDTNTTNTIGHSFEIKYASSESNQDYNEMMFILRKEMAQQNKVLYLNTTYPYITGSYRAFYEIIETLLDLIGENTIPQNEVCTVYDACAIAFFVRQLFDTLVTAAPEVFEPLRERMSKIHIRQIYDNDFEKKFNRKYTANTRAEFIDYIKTNYPERQTKILKEHIRHSVKFICDRGVSHELVRHRPASFAQESTRYCNYGKGKFGSEITVIDPCFWQDDKADCRAKWMKACETAEQLYFELLEAGAIPQEARDVLPNSLKTEITVTATEEEWQHILDLRLHGVTGAPHPQMVEIMNIAYPQLVAASENRLA